MSTPVLTKKQQKHSLSAKKTPAKGLRNVLAQPHDNYWPIIDADKCALLEDILKKLTPIMKRPTHAIPWSQLRHMKKEERVLAKKEALSKQEHIPDKDTLNSIVLGINAVTRSLEKDNVCCVLLDANVEPLLLIKHIIIMAQNKELPILVLPSLKSITLNTIGFASAAFALKNIVMESSDHRLNALYQKALDIFKDIPRPKRALQLFKNDETLDDNTFVEDTEMSIENEAKMNVVEPEKFTLSTNVYKHRLSRKERAFIPPSAAESTAVQSMECDDFISISKYNAESIDDTSTMKKLKNMRYVNIHDKEDTGHKLKKSSQLNPTSVKNDGTNKNNSTMNVKYLSLKVKRLQSNSNRVKATKISKQKKK